MNRNFKQSLIGLSLLVGIAAPVAAIAASIDDRVSQLERATTAQGQLLTSLQQQMNDTQRDIDDLRGQIQTAQYQLNQLTERQRTLSQQIDELINQPAAAKPAANTGGSKPTSPAKPAVAAKGSGNEEQDYQTAINYVMKDKDYDKGLEAFSAFVTNYPKSKHASNSNYWLGQLLFIKGQKDEAARYFAIVVRDYAKSGKAPDALFKIGVIMQDKKQVDNAKKIYQQVISQYPGTASAKQAQQRLDGLK
jgi:tol-pal system protein YbgF